MSVYFPGKVSNQISLYAARGTLIEPKGPSWFYGTGLEHTALYQYQLCGPKDVSLRFTLHGQSQISRCYSRELTWQIWPGLFWTSLDGDPLLPAGSYLAYSLRIRKALSWLPFFWKM